MSAVEDTIALLQTLIDQLGEAKQTTSAAIDQAEQARELAEAVGVQAGVAAFSEVEELVREIPAAMQPALEKAQEAVDLARAIADG